MYGKTIRRLQSICYLMSFAIVSKNKKPKPYNFSKVQMTHNGNDEKKSLSLKWHITNSKSRYVLLIDR